MEDTSIHLDFFFRNGRGSIFFCGRTRGFWSMCPLNRVPCWNSGFLSHSHMATRNGSSARQPKFDTVVGHDGQYPCYTTLKPQLKPFVGIRSGIIIPGLLMWCRNGAGFRPSTVSLFGNKSLGRPSNMATQNGPWLKSPTRKGLAKGIARAVSLMVSNLFPTLRNVPDVSNSFETNMGVSWGYPVFAGNQGKRHISRLFRLEICLLAQPANSIRALT